MKKFNSQKTFKQEFVWLLNNLPEALDLTDMRSVSEIISDHFSGNNLTVDTHSLDIDKLDLDDIESIFYDSSIDYIASDEPADFDSSEVVNVMDETMLEEIILDLGNESFGMYLPMHRFYGNSRNNWGIYLFNDMISSQAKRLSKKFEGEITFQRCKRLYRYCVYRHELFHYHTEKFATMQEVLVRKPFYLNYSDNIYSKYARTENWLEEALAEDSVLKSRLVSKRSVISSALLKKIYSYDLTNMPPGYRDNQCLKHGGTKNAHRILASQIIHGENFNPIPTDAMTVKSTFNTNDKNVPVYLVRNLKIKRVQ